MRLEGKTALIIGAGERMSRAVALLFALEGAKVALAARRKEVTEETARMIRAHGGEAIVFQGDATQDADISRIVGGTIASFGRLDILYNNVGGGYFRDQGRLQVPDEAWDRIIAANLRGIHLAAKYAIPVMIQAGGGVVLNVAASLKTRQDGTAAYAAGKSGVIGLTLSLAREYLPQNIRVNCLCPGLIRGSVDPDRLAPLRESLMRMGRPEDVAYAALYLA